MNKYLVVAIICLCVAMSVLLDLYTGEKNERERFESNQGVLLSDVRFYKVRDSLSAASVERLQFTVRELEKYKGDAVQLIEDLNVKLKRVQSIGKTGTETRYEVKAEVRDSVVFREKPVPVKTFHFSDAYLFVSGLIEENKFTGLIVSMDTLVQVVHRVPRKIWFIRYGTKAIRQEIVSKNPHMRIVYSEYIELKK